MDCGPCGSGSSKPAVYYQQAQPVAYYKQQAQPAVVYKQSAQPAVVYRQSAVNYCPPVNCNPCPPVICNPCPPVNVCNPCLPGGPEFFNFCVATINTNPEEKDPHPALYSLRSLVFGVKAILVVNVAT